LHGCVNHGGVWFGMAWYLYHVYTWEEQGGSSLGTLLHCRKRGRGYGFVDVREQKDWFSFVREWWARVGDGREEDELYVL